MVRGQLVRTEPGQGGHKLHRGADEGGGRGSPDYRGAHVEPEQERKDDIGHDIERLQGEIRRRTSEIELRSAAGTLSDRVPGGAARLRRRLGGRLR